MACRYEEEIYAATGKMDACGCPTCPYKTEDQCFEVKPMPKEKDCPKCGGVMVLSRTCGVFVCDECDHHDGLARCFCGWSASGGDGRAELEEMGETIDEDY